MSRSKNFNTKYSPEFKISVIIDMRENGLSYKATMRKYSPQFPPKNYNFIKQWSALYARESIPVVRVFAKSVLFLFGIYLSADYLPKNAFL